MQLQLVQGYLRKVKSPRGKKAEKTYVGRKNKIKPMLGMNLKSKERDDRKVKESSQSDLI